VTASQVPAVRAAAKGRVIFPFAYTPATSPQRYSTKSPTLGMEYLKAPSGEAATPSVATNENPAAILRLRAIDGAEWPRGQDREGADQEWERPTYVDGGYGCES
jgi:hypothetical protein